MKKYLSFLFLFLFLSFSSPANAQMSLLAMATDFHWYPGRVVLTDGTTSEYPAIRLPRYVDVSLVVSEDGEKHNKHIKYDPDEVAYIEVWHKHFPDSVYRLYSMRTEKKYSTHFWSTVDIAGEHGMLMKGAHSYEIDEETGELFGKVYSSGTAPAQFAYFVWLEGEQYFQLWTPYSKRKMAKIFAKDPTLSTLLKEGKEEVTVEFLLDNYTPQE